MYINKKENNNSSALLSGALSLTASVVIVKLLGFIYKLPLSRILGDEGMGYFNSAYTVFTFFYMIATGGIPKAVSILVSKAGAGNDKLRAGAVLRYSLVLFAALGAFLSLALAILRVPISVAIGNPDCAPSLLTVSPALLFVALSGVLRGYLAGNMRMGWIAVSEIAEGAVKLVLGMLFAFYAVRQNHGVEIISAYTVLGVSVAALVSTSILAVCTKNVNSHNKTRQNCESAVSATSVYKSLFSISIPIMLAGAILGFSGIIDLSLVVNRLTYSGMPRREAVALFGNYTTLCVPMLNLSSSLLAPISSSALPHLVRASSSGGGASMRRLFDKLVLITASLCAPMCFVFSFFPQHILSILFSRTSAYVGAPMLCALAPACLFLPLLTLFNTALEASGRSRTSMLAITVGALIKAAVCYLCVANPQCGIIGAPLSTVVMYAVARDAL